MSEASKNLRRRGAEHGRLAEMAQGDAFHLPFADATFDRIICSEVMEHVHDYRGALSELARVAKPGAKIAVTIPTATSEHLYLRLGDEYFESPGGHIRIFKPRELAEGMAAAGFDAVGCGFAHGFHTPYWVLRSVMHLPDADLSLLVRIYRDFLIRATASKWMDRLERILNYVCPKSVIVYGAKPKAPKPAKASDDSDDRGVPSDGARKNREAAAA
jgi:SAM-dependent methyltransferase